MGKLGSRFKAIQLVNGRGGTETLARVLSCCAESTPFQSFLKQLIPVYFSGCPHPQPRTIHFLPSLLHFLDPNFSKIFKTSLHLGANTHLTNDCLVWSRRTWSPGSFPAQQQQASITFMVTSSFITTEQRADFVVRASGKGLSLMYKPFREA